MTGYRGYISSQMLERSVPQYVQQLVIRDFCQKNGLKFLLSATEYHEGVLMLKNIISDDSIIGIVFYSIFQLPKDYNFIFHTGKQIFFAAENMRVLEKQERDKLDDIFLLRSILCVK